MSDQAALGGTLALYLVSAALLGATLVLRQVWLRTLGWALAGAGAALHMVAIGLRCAELHRAPFVTPGESLSLLAWLLVLLYLGAQALWRLTAAGALAMGLAFLLVFLAGRVSDVAPEPGGGLLEERAISLHVVATLTAFGAFALASCCAALYLWEKRILKSKHGLAWLVRLPPLAVVDRAALTLVALGFPLLSLGILSGLVRAASGGMKAGWPTDPKLLLAYGLWGVYGLYLGVRLRGGWPAGKAAALLLVGALLCLLVFLVPTAAHRFVG